MKAVLCQAYGAPESLTLCEQPLPPLRDKQLRIRVHAAGVNFVDALFIAGTYQVKIPPPFVPGNELAGVVTDVGASVTSFKPGDRVMAQAGTGAFAETATLDAARVRAMPAGFSFEHAAAFQLTYATALYALRERAQLQPGESLLVLGAGGGVGSAAIDVGRVMGANPIIAAAGTADKLRVCQTLGATHVIDYLREDLKERAKALTAGQGANVVLDPVGGAYADAALRATAWEGRFLVVGFAAGEIPKVALNLPLLKGCQIVGVDWGQLSRVRPQQTEPVWTQLEQWAANGALRPLVHQRYPLDQTASALRDVLDRRVIGKAVIVMD